MRVFAVGLVCCLLCASPAAALEPPLAEGTPAAAEAGPALDDPRAIEALRRVHAGDVIGAQRLWREIADEAKTSGRPEALDAAERALADLAFLRGHYAEVAQIYQARLGRARAAGDRLREADARLQLALVDRRQGRLDAAGASLQDALALFREAGDRDGEAETLTHLGLVLLNQGEFVRAIEVLEGSLALHRAGAKVSLDRTYQYLGLLYLGMRDYDEARAQLTRALAEARRQRDPMRASAPLGSLARIANDQGEHQRALEFAAEAQSLSERFDSPPGLAYSGLERGRALLGLGRHDEARKALDEARGYAQAVDQERTVADIDFTLGRVALAEGDPASALALFESATRNYEAAGDVPQLHEAYEAMVPLLRDAGNLERALQLSIASQDLLRQISGRESSRRIALIEYRHQVESSQRQIEQLARENEIKALRLSREEFGRQVGLGVIAALLLLALTLAALYRRSRRISAELAASNQELRQSRMDLADSHASLAEKAQALQVAATSDALTGIANRRHVLELLDRVVASANQHGRELAIALIDVDRFKSINDTYGHGVGDQVLCRVVQTIQSLLPSQAVLGRYGGEEFLLVLPDHDLPQALRLAESALALIRTERPPEQPAVTLSVGVAVHHGGGDAQAARMIEDADRALYRAKEGGRDRVVEASDRPAPDDDWG